MREIGHETRGSPLRAGIGLKPSERLLRRFDRESGRPDPSISGEGMRIATSIFRVGVRYADIRTEYWGR
jgi:hypothetical protein